MASSSKKVVQFTHPDFDKVVMQWFDEIDSGNSDNDVDPNVYIRSDHYWESEQELSDSEAAADNVNVSEVDDNNFSCNENEAEDKENNP